MTRDKQMLEMAHLEADVIYDKFQAYYWHEVDGWMPDDEATMKVCLKVVDLLISEQTMWQNGETDPVLYWQEVKSELKKML